MANVIKIQNKTIRINPKDNSRLEYLHEGSNEWMDDGAVPGEVDDLDYDDKSKSHVILYMKNGKKYRWDIYNGRATEIKEKKKESKEESQTEDPEKKSLLSIIWGLIMKKKKEPETKSFEMPPMMGGMVPPSMSNNDTSTKKSSSIIVKILKAIWWIVKLPFRILKFIYDIIPV